MGKEILGSLELNRAYQMDCLDGMKLIPDKSIDMILCDLPYGTTACKWDTIIPFEPLWEQYERIIKDCGAIVLTGAEPFSSKLRLSNLKLYRYDWVWEKTLCSNFMNVKNQPKKLSENILVFYKKQPTYNPIMLKGKPFTQKKRKQSSNQQKLGVSTTKEYVNTGTRYPSNIIKFSNGNNKNIHPTQKPVALFEYLIKTYTNENEVVLDNCLGSGTTAVACELNKRKWIGFETESEYIELINKRLDQIQLDNDLKDYE